MAQIAQRAGVALSSVSSALSGKRARSDEAQAKVLQAVAAAITTGWRSASVRRATGLRAGRRGARAASQTSYTLSKVLGEEMARQFKRSTGIPFVGFRYSNIMERAGYERFPSYWDESTCPQVEPLELRRREPRRAEHEACARSGDRRSRDVRDRRRRHRHAAVEQQADGRGLSRRPHPEASRRARDLLGIDKARAMLGYEPTFTWRNVL